jgi:hypothetical protein
LGFAALQSGVRRNSEPDMVQPDYSASGTAVRQDLRDCHRFILEHVTSPGTWWSGADRRAIAEESRAATSCGLCRQRKGALSANAPGEHQSTGLLAAAVVDVIHRIRTDPARLSRSWFDAVVPAVLADTHYVELVGVVTLMAGIDNFARALGVPIFALPAPAPGEPSRHRPTTAKPGTAWVPMIDVADAAGPEADMYPDAPVVPNIVRALSLVPDQVRALRRSSDAHYLPIAQIGDPTARRATIDRMQMELVAARVSALNECFY